MKIIITAIAFAFSVSGCATSKIINPNDVRTFDDSSTGLRCYELIDSHGDPHFACTKRNTQDAKL